LNAPRTSEISGDPQHGIMFWAVTKQQWWTEVTGTYAPFSTKVFKSAEESYIFIL